MSIFVPSLLAAIVCAFGLSTSPATLSSFEDDCLCTGPFYAGAGAQAPTIIDNGSIPSSNDAGCDGCSAYFYVTVFFWHTGSGAVNTYSGSYESFPSVTPGTYAVYSGTVYFDCGKAAAHTAYNTTANPQSWQQFYFLCSQCG